MKALSLWALMNPVKSWIIIAICQTMLTLIAIYDGIWLFAQDIFIPKFVFYLGVTIFFIAFTFYPIRRARYIIWKYSYARQKFMDVLMLIGFMMSVISVSNWDATAAWNDSRDQASAIPVVLKAFERTEHGITQTKNWDVKEIRKKLKHKYQEFVVDTKLQTGKPADKSGKPAGLVFLTVLLIIILVAFVCVLACSSGEASGVVAILGLLALALIIAIILIRNKAKRKNQYEPMRDG